ncbi:MAG TPA: hypothetical protein VF614_03965, partial [Chthoniobacteraceae bacterium]
LSCEWTVVSGSEYGEVQFSDPANPQSTATFSGAGLYRLKLTVSDGVYVRSAENELFVYTPEVTSSLQLTTTPATGGTSSSFTYGPTSGVYRTTSHRGYFSIDFDGVAADRPGWDLTFDLPANAPFAPRTYQVPAGTGESQPQLTIKDKSRIIAHGAGSFVVKQVVSAADGRILAFWATFERAAGYGSATVSGEIKYFAGIPLASVNQPPQVHAGPDQVASLDSSVALVGTAADDDLPQPTSFALTWSAVSGPGVVSYTKPTELETHASFSHPGTYTLRLTASDGQLVRTDDLVVRVYDPQLGNRLVVGGVDGPGASTTLTFTEREGEFSVQQNASGGVSVRMLDSSHPSSWPELELHFVAPRGVPLDPARLYQEAEPYPRQSPVSPGFMLDVDGVRGGSGAEFTIHEFTLSASGEVTRFHATFALPDGIAGEVRYRPSAPFSTPPGGVFRAVSGDRLTVSSDGHFSAALQTKRSVLRFKGQFDSFGRWSGTIDKQQISLLLTTKGIVGAVMNDIDHIMQWVDLLRPWSPTRDVPHSPAAGRYTFALELIPTTVLRQQPNAPGWGRMKVSRSGSVRLAGRLGHGEPFNYAGWLSESGHLQIGSPVRVNPTALGGKLVFVNDPERLLGVTGTLTYKAKSYESAYRDDKVAEFIGSRWVDHGSARESLSGSASPVTGRLTLLTRTDKVLLSTAVHIHPDNSVQVLGEYADRLKLKLTREGTIDGSLDDPTLGPVIHLSGAILQDRRVGRGYWLQKAPSAPATTGDLRLELVR